jgi:hypothetical protein
VERARFSDSPNAQQARSSEKFLRCTWLGVATRRAALRLRARVAVDGVAACRWWSLAPARISSSGWKVLKAW